MDKCIVFLKLFENTGILYKENAGLFNEFLGFLFVSPTK